MVSDFLEFFFDFAVWPLKILTSQRLLNAKSATVTVNCVGTAGSLKSLKTQTCGQH